MPETAHQIKLFRTFDGKRPFVEWFDSIRDRRAKQKIQVRLDRLSLGNFGDHHRVGEGVTELRIDYGPGYRIYFGFDGNSLVVLLIRGDKSSQHDDIKAAKKYWREYKEEQKHAS